MSVRYTQVDSFSAEPFRGNPAAVLVLDALPSAAWMQHVASELGLPATAFVVEPAAGGDDFVLRWFTRAAELQLCGHGTLAASRVLWEHGLAPAGELIAFAAPAGPLRASRRGDWIELDFPATPPSESPPPAGLAEALGVTPSWVGRSRFDVVAILDDEKLVREAMPDLGALRRVEARGVMISAASAGGGFDFVSRFFAPRIGIDEDSVTGSAHCSLAPYWAARLGRQEMVGYQASPRGGVVRVRLAGDRVVLGGQTAIVARGELLVDPE
ncbi:MAG TPA: PhzF family phenazine biosynthesis protein [Thermoanaerobaculia bacterium]|jgi:PhzF family phenazine biosynthesis protein|nr:PhzF family phenazine biosynthesis protein [Thermoanaerobaculia bacterium]